MSEDFERDVYEHGKAARRYTVPVGMINAAWVAVGAKMKECVDKGYGNRPAELHVARIAVEAALRWLSENPVIPSQDEIGKKFPEWSASSFQAQKVIMWWQRHMFLAPESNWVDDVIETAPTGYTPTHEELDKIWNHIFRAGHGWFPPESRKEEIISDLFFQTQIVEKGRTMTANERIQEAYRRGKERIK